MKNNSNSNQNYSSLAKWLHWSFVVLFAYGIYKQVDDLSDLEDLSLLKFEIFFAFIFLLFLVFRFVYMTTTQKTSLPENTPKAQKFLAKLVHYSMYFCLFIIVLSGLMIGLSERRITDTLLISGTCATTLFVRSIAKIPAIRLCKERIFIYVMPLNN